MVMKERLGELLIDIVDVLQKHVHDEMVRYEVYDELMDVFADKDLVESALGDDPIFDKVYRERLGEEIEIDEEDQ